MNSIAYIGKLLFIVGMVILGATAFTFLAVGILSPFIGFDTALGLMKQIDKGQGFVNSRKLITGLSSIGTFVVPAIAFSLFYYRSFFGFFKTEKKVSLQVLGLSLLLVVFANPVLQWFIGISKTLPLPAFLEGLDKSSLYEQLLGSFFEDVSFLGLVFNLVVIAAIPAIGEELLFRGVLMRHFTQWTKSVLWGIVVSALVFGLVHAQVYLFLPITMMGVLFGILYHLSGNIWLPIAVHFFNNGIQVLLLYLFKKGIIDLDIDSIETIPFFVAAGSFILFVAVFILLMKQFKIQNEHGEGMDKNL